MEYSWPWPSTEDPGPQVGDGRKVTSTEFAYLLLKLFNAGVVPVDNELVVTSPGANQIEVDAGYAIVMGKWYGADAAVALAPDSAPAATTRKDSVILQCDWTGGGATEQYTVRAITKEGTAGAYPALTQTENTLWEDRLYNYTIDDAGAITGITDARTMAAFNTGVATAMIQDDAVTADKIAAAVAGNGLAGGGGAALSVNVDGSTIEINADTLRVKASGITANEIAAGAVGASEIAAAVAGNGLAGGGGAELSVNVDGSTIEINADAIRVKASGITANEIAANAVGASEIAAGAVDTSELANTSVTLAKMDNNSIGTLKIVDGAVTAAKLDDGVKPIKGSIMMWSGTMGGAGSHHPVDPDTAIAIDEWHIANGDTVNGVVTPNLVDRFIVGVGSTYAMGNTGGAANQAHGVNITTGGPSLPGMMYGSNAELVADNLHTHLVNGNTANADNRPPYYALVFLCYVGA